MKTSLVIEDYLFQVARREADKTHQTIGEVLSLWARAGRDFLAKMKTKKKFHPCDLGGQAQIDINSRAEWMELLDT